MGEENEPGSESEKSVKVPHGQRTFLAEVGIIVLGVLIALVIGEIATAVRQRVEARRSMAAIRSDMIDNSASFEMSVFDLSCAGRRIDAVSRELEQARRIGRLSDIGEIGRSWYSTFRMGSWDSAVSNRDVLFLPPDQVAELTDYHEAMAILQELQQQMNLDWSRLAVLSHAPGRIDDNTLSAARQTIAELRFRTRAASLAATLMLETHRRLGFPVVYTPFNNQPRTREQSLRRLRERDFCRPLQVNGRADPA